MSVHTEIKTKSIAIRLLKMKFRKFRKALFFTFFIFSFTTTYARVNREVKHKHKERHLIVNRVRRALIQNEVKHVDIVLRQSILETGWFSCTQCSLQKNNLFGFRYKKKYLEFETIEESVAYYKKWQNKHYNGGNYYKFLQKIGYATDPEYIKLLKAIKLR